MNMFEEQTKVCVDELEDKMDDIGARIDDAIIWVKYLLAKRKTQKIQEVTRGTSPIMAALDGKLNALTTKFAESLATKMADLATAVSATPPPTTTPPSRAVDDVLDGKIDALTKMVDSLASKTDQLTAAVSAASSSTKSPSTEIELPGNISCEVGLINAPNPAQKQTSLSNDPKPPSKLLLLLYEGSKSNYKGERLDDVEVFLEDYERQIRSQRGGPSEFLSSLESCLKGDAQEWFDKFVKNPSPESQWADLRNKIRTRYLDPCKEAERHLAFTTRKEESYESIKKYLESKSNLFYKAMPLGNAETLLCYAKLGAQEADRRQDKSSGFIVLDRYGLLAFKEREY